MRFTLPFLEKHMANLILRTVRRPLSLWVGIALLAGFGLATQAQASTYWYEDYLVAVRMMEKGSTAQAEPILQRAIKANPLSGHSERIAGNRLISYHPYYYRAVIRYQRGDLRSARMDLELEEAMGQIQQNSELFAALQDLRSRIVPQMAHGTTTGAKPVKEDPGLR